MIDLKDGTLLYHASYAEIKEIDLSKGRQGLDFGKGFYVTSSYDQAYGYMLQALKKARRVGIIPYDFRDADGMINVYSVHLNPDLTIHCFEEADVSWLHFVAANRDDSLFPDVFREYESVDIIAGKVANDYTARTLALYTSGAYGNPGDEETDAYTLRLLLPNRLQDQFCFRTEMAAQSLEFVRGDRYGDIT